MIWHFLTLHMFINFTYLVNYLGIHYRDKGNDDAYGESCRSTWQGSVWRDWQSDDSRLSPSLLRTAPVMSSAGLCLPDEWVLPWHNWLLDSETLARLQSTTDGICSVAVTLQIRQHFKHTLIITVSYLTVIIATNQQLSSDSCLLLLI